MKLTTWVAKRRAPKKKTLRYSFWHSEMSEFHTVLVARRHNCKQCRRDHSGRNI
jgi:hypothetical protein